jgi:peptidoglycan/LPS O-acetylase OafA/YrhL
MLPAYLPYFAIGMALAVWNQHRDRTRSPLSGALTLGLVATAGAIVVLDGLWHLSDAGAEHGLLGVVGDIPAALGFALLLGATLIGTGRAVSWLSWRPLVGLGVISYGFYLWHLPLMLFWRRLGLEGGWVETAALTFPVTLAISVASWKLVESPILKRAHSASKPATHHPRTAQADTVKRRRELAVMLHSS